MLVAEWTSRLLSAAPDEAIILHLLDQLLNTQFQTPAHYF